MAESKTSQAVLDQVRYDYEMGNFKSVYELAERYGINKNTLHQRVIREKWEELRLKKLKEIERESDQNKALITKNWLKKVYQRSEKDWNLIDQSIDSIGPLVDCDAMRGYISARKMLNDMARQSLGIADPTQNLDIKTNGLSLGDSMISALQKIRTDKTIPALDDNDLERILEAEIVDDTSEVK